MKTKDLLIIAGTAFATVLILKYLNKRPVKDIKILPNPSGNATTEINTDVLKFR